jgi:flavin-dependent dehydrogenase
MVAEDRNVLCSGSGSEAVEKFMRLPFYESWFRHARVVKKLATTTAVDIRTAIMEPVAGNVLIVGDAAAFIEATIPGAIACGYQGAKVIFKELNGHKGYPEYVKWWQKVIETNCPGYSEATSRYYTLNKVCSSEEIDYLYHLVQDQEGLPVLLVAKNLERIKDERPELYTKLKETGIEESIDDVDKVKMDLHQVLGADN